ncbi:MAG: phage head-tail connector protein [Actinomycetota bacterium]
MAYALLADLKSAIRVTDVDDDALLTLALDAASDLINSHCDRTFVASPAASARSFLPSGGRADVDDIYTTDGLIVTDRGRVVPAYVENTTPSGYVLLPFNAPIYNEPYTEIDYNPGITAWPNISGFRQNRIVVTAKWGYAAAVPTLVKQACILQASRLFSRRNSPYGIAGSPDMGSEIRLLAKVDPDVAVMLRKFVKDEVL